jgi:glutamyl-tRNA synthetase
VLRAIGAVKTRSRTTIDVAKQVAVRLDARHVTPDEKAQQEIAKDPEGYKGALQAAIAALRNAEWTTESLEKGLRALADQRGVPAGKIFQPIRIALTGGTVSEPVNELLFVIGKESSLRRLEDAAR